MRKFAAVVCGFIGLLSAVFVCAAIGDLVTGAPRPGILIGLVVFFGGISAGAGVLARRLWRRPAFDPAAFEPQALQLAAKNAGRLTVAEVAMGLQVPIASAKLILDHLVTNGVADTLVADSGELVYAVQGMLGAADKATARGVLEDRVANEG